MQIRSSVKRLPTRLIIGGVCLTKVDAFAWTCLSAAVHRPSLSHRLDASTQGKRQKCLAYGVSKEEERKSRTKIDWLSGNID